MLKRTKPPKHPRLASKADGRIGERIRLRRVELGMSQSQLGSSAGVSFQQIQKYEKGVNRVTAARLEVLADALDVEQKFFFDEPDNPERKEVESLLFIDSNFSLRMLRAYSKIKDRSVAHQLVVLMEGIAS